MFDLPALPYDLDALEPIISKETLTYHYGKHHQGYVNKLNELIKGTEYENLPLKELMQKTFKNQPARDIFNNAAQVWNHTFYWHCLTPHKNLSPSHDLQQAIEQSFGSLEQFKQQFKKKALSQFGSGWVWLVKNSKDGLEVISTNNAENPLILGQTPLLTIDVWEHAYYIDYRNARGEYIDSIWNLIDWRFVSDQFTSSS